MRIVTRVELYFHAIIILTVSDYLWIIQTASQQRIFVLILLINPIVMIIWEKKRLLLWFVLIGVVDTSHCLVYRLRTYLLLKILEFLSHGFSKFLLHDEYRKKIHTERKRWSLRESIGWNIVNLIFIILFISLGVRYRFFFKKVLFQFVSPEVILYAWWRV